MARVIAVGSGLGACPRQSAGPEIFFSGTNGKSSNYTEIVDHVPEKDANKETLEPSIPEAGRFQWQTFVLFCFVLSRWSYATR